MTTPTERADPARDIWKAGVTELLAEYLLAGRSFRRPRRRELWRPPHQTTGEHMTEMPTMRTRTTKRHEWVIALPADAKEFRIGLHRIYRQMEEITGDLSFDDAFHVRADEEELVLWVERSEENT